MNPMTTSNALRWRNITAILLGLFGTVAMVGDLIGSRSIKGLGAVSAVAPFPKVFCKVAGIEGFACAFTIVYEDGGEIHCLPVTPELYSHMSGPYNRRNVYGAALAGGAILPRELWGAVFDYGFAPDGPLRREFGIPAEAANLRVVVQSKTRGSDEVWTLQRKCR